MNLLRMALLFAVCVLFASSAVATTPPSSTQVAPQVSPVVLPVLENSGIHHATHKTGPLVVNWVFKKSLGSANVAVNPDGTYLFSGSYKGKVPRSEDFELALGLKNNRDEMYMFDYRGPGRKGVKWSQQGKSEFLKDDFKTFNKHDWLGAYRLPLTAEGKKEKVRCGRKGEETVYADFIAGVYKAVWKSGQCKWVYQYWY